MKRKLLNIQHRREARMNHTGMIHTKSKQLSLWIQYCPKLKTNTDEKWTKHLRTVSGFKGLNIAQITKQKG